jgi:ABC-type multidrug transport system fused ATPase/permease subunit
VGPSGAGKSTTLKLILRAYDPSTGSVKIDGQDIRHMTLASLWKNVGIILQDITFPDESILSILQYANPNASLDEIEKACETVGLLGWVETLPAGFETTVGERGMQISGGQRQRLSIAQNIIKMPKILLLDEPTSAIDAENKRLVHRYLKESPQTKIIITHDLDAVRDVDKVIVIKDGMVVDQGNHEQLMGRPGYYRDVLHRQHHREDQQDPEP